jgi:hypothetical protein
MRRIERVSGLLAGLLAIVAGLLAFWLPADQTVANTVVFGPGVSASLHNAIIPPVAIIIVAALAIATTSLLDARRPAHSRALVALALVATIVCALGAGVLLAGNIALVFAAPPDRGSGLILQYNAGALFIPTLVAAIVCAITAIWPRRAAQPAARAVR